MSNRAALLTFVAILLGLLLLFLKMIAPFIISVMMGAIFALLLHPLFKKLLNTLSPKLSAVTVTLILSLIIGGPLIAFSTMAVRQGKLVGEGLARNKDLSYQVISEKLSVLPMADSLVGDQAAIEQKIRDNVQTLGETISTGVLRFLAHLPELFLHLILALFTCFVFLLNGKFLAHWTFAKIPIDRDVEENIKKSAENTARSVIFSVLAAAGTESFIIFFGFLILNVPGAFFAAGATFILSFVPIVSCTPVWLAGALYLYLHGLTIKAFAMIAVGILTAIAENVVKPIILKGASNMHPLLSLIAIFGGLQMYGLFGVLLGPIIANLLVSLLEIWPIVGRRSGIKFGES